MYDQPQTAQTVTYHAGSLRVSTQATNAPIISVNRFDQNVVEVILHPDAPHVVVNLGPLFETVQRLLACAWNAITQRIHIHFQMTGDQQNPNFTVFWSNSNLITAANAVGHIDQQINTTYQAQDDFKKAVCRFYFDVINGAQ